MVWNTILRIEIAAMIAAVIYIVVFAYDPSVITGRDTLLEDPMAISGSVLTVLGVFLAWFIQRTFNRRLGMMFNSGAIQMPGHTADEIQAMVEKNAARCFFAVFGVLLALFILGVMDAPSIESGKKHLYMGGTLAVFLVSVRFSYGVATGLAGRFLQKNASQFVLAPSHPDGSSGFGHLGYYYFEQALGLLLPALFMLFWIAYVNLVENKISNAMIENYVIDQTYDFDIDESEVGGVVSQYVTCELWTPPGHNSLYCPDTHRTFNWGGHFANLIVFNLVIFLLAWIVPNWFLRQGMKAHKKEVIKPKIFELEERIREDRKRLMSLPAGSQDSIALHTKIDEMAVQLSVSRSCPTLPLPLFTVLTAMISNLSAIIGVLGVGFI